MHLSGGGEVLKAENWGVDIYIDIDQFQVQRSILFLFISVLVDKMYWGMFWDFVETQKVEQKLRRIILLTASQS